MAAPVSNGATDIVGSECSELNLKMKQNAPWKSVLTIENMNPFIRSVEPLRNTALTMFKRIADHDRDLRQGVKKSFDNMYLVNLGDSHGLGQRPITFVRQVLALCTYPELLDNPSFPEDAKQRARRMLAACRGGQSIGSYTDAIGFEHIRQNVAAYITERDGGIQSNFDDVFLCNGATAGLRAVLNLSMNGRNSPHQAGIMIPIPQYPIYGMAITEYNGYQIPYYLDEDNDWALNIDELQRSIDSAKGHCEPRAIVVINPGNPTGQVLSRQNIVDVIEFAKKEKLFIIADEVYQQNIYEDDYPFHSFRKVLKELGEEYAKMQLVSIMSASKGVFGECGTRGGYLELINFDKQFTSYIHWLSRECPATIGQITIDLIVNPPKRLDSSYERFCQEKNSILNGFAVSSRLTSDFLNSLEGIRCNQVRGAMYAYPRITIPDGALREAKATGMVPDEFYCSELLNATGICVMPGSSFGQKDGTHHFRMTIMSSTDEQKKVLNLFKGFHVSFLTKYKH